MSVTHTTTVRNGIADYVTNLIDAGTDGKLVIRLAGTAASPGTEVARLTFSATAFGGSTGGQADAAAITADTAATGNASAVSTATLEDSAGNVAAHCSVGATSSGEDIELSSTTIAANDTVSISALTYTAPL